MLVRDPYYLALHRADGPARGTVLLIHGGGWHGGLGPAADELMRPVIDGLVGWGYDVANLGYRGGARSLHDATAAFDLLRRRLGPEVPICIYGTSAGGQLGLIVAAMRGDGVDCLVDLLGPPDLEDFGTRPRSGAGEGQARQAFGADRLAELSPVNNAERIESPVLIGAAPCDVFVSLAHQREFARRLEASGADVRLVVIAPGDDVDLEHCLVSRRSFERFQQETREFLNAAAPAPPSVDPAPPEDDDGFRWPLLLGALALAAGALLLVRALRR